jgi:hypothetical protein
MAMLLSVALILTVSLMRSLSKGKEKTVFAIGAFMMLADIILIGDGAAIFGTVIGLIVYFVIAARATVTTVALLSSGAVYAFFIMPEALARKVGLFFEGLFAALSATFGAWQGHFQIVVAALFGGVGVNAAEKLYPMFSTTGVENSAGTESLALRILCDLGIIGLLVFLALAVIFLQNCFEYLSISKDKGSRLLTVGGLCAVVALLSQGAFFDVWCNFGTFYLFWFVFALTFACTRCGRAELERTKKEEIYNAERASVDINTEQFINFGD